MLYDPDAVARALAILLAPGQVTELRVLGGRRTPESRPGIFSGYFNDPAALVRALGELRGGWEGVYVVPNPVLPDLLARRLNKIDWCKRGESTTDAHIIARHWLLVDVDPVRPKGISATQAEHDLSIERAGTIRADLVALGWPDPILASSGNGAHLVWRVDLAADSDLPKRMLAALAHYDDAAVTVDPTVCNAARIWKLYGTLACKGEDMPDRPHRMAAILAEPAEPVPVPVELLQDYIAKHAPVPVAPPARPPRATTAIPAPAATFDPLAVAAAGGLELDEGRRGDNGATIYPAHVCPCDRKETDRAAFLSVSASGAVGLGCLHATCDYSGGPGTRGAHWVRWRAAHDQNAYQPPPVDRTTVEAKAEAWAAGQRQAPPEDWGGFTDNATASTAAPVTAPPQDGAVSVDGRLQINIGIDTRDVRDKTLGVLAQSAGLYASAGMLARADDSRMAQLSAAGLDSVAVDLCEFVTFKRSQAGEWETKPAALPPRVLAMLGDLSPAQLRPFRTVSQVTRSPFFTPAGGAVLANGYSDAAQQLLVDCPAVRLDAAPTPAAALAYLRDLVADFPFDSESEASNWIGALVAVVARPMIRGPLPLLMIEANKPGSGKTLLAKMIQGICGLPIESSPLPKDEKAVAQLLLSILLNSQAVHVFDNVTHAVVSASLDMVLTSDSYTDRILGKSKTVTCAVRQLWILTVNNGRLSRDMARRISRVRLRDDTGAPEERTGFRHGDVLAHVQAHRGEILSRVCQLVASWVAAGQPVPADLPRLGSFEAWCRVVGGVLRHAGDTAWMANARQAREAVTDDGWEPFVVAWAQHLPAAGVKASQLVALCLRHDLLLEVLGTGTDGSQASRLGHALRARRDQILHGYRLSVDKDERTRQSSYSLARVDPLAPAQAWS